MPLPRLACALALATLAWRGTAPDAALDLTAAALPDGGVELRWSAPAGPGLELRRAYDAQAFTPPADLVPVVTRWPLASAHGRLVDRHAADGTPYAYALARGGRLGAAITVTTPDRTLAACAHPALWVDKHFYTLAVVDGGRVRKRYPIAMGRLPARRKLHFDNASTPEGLYHILAAQPRATYHRAYDLDYPNALDRVRYTLARGATAGYPAIGGEVQIHGRGIAHNWTWGCVALRDEDIDELFTHRELGPGCEVRLWGGELTEADVAALAAGPPDTARWRTALARQHVSWDGRPGEPFWRALGRFQLQAGLPLSCVPDAATRAKLGL